MDALLRDNRRLDIEPISPISLDGGQRSIEDFDHRLRSGLILAEILHIFRIPSRKHAVLSDELEDRPRLGVVVRRIGGKVLIAQRFRIRQMRRCPVALLPSAQ